MWVKFKKGDRAVFKGKNVTVVSCRKAKYLPDVPGNYIVRATVNGASGWVQANATQFTPGKLLEVK